MARLIAQRDLRNRNAQIMADVEAGTTFVVTRKGTPVAELRPIPGGRRRFVTRAELATVAAAGPHVDAQRFRDDLERTFDQRLASG